MNEDLMLVEDVAAELGAAPATIREWCARCDFPHRRMPNKRRLLFSRRDVMAYLDGAELDVKRLAGDGRVVKPKPQRKAA